jgi:hypothetical protein
MLINSQVPWLHFMNQSWLWKLVEVRFHLNTIAYFVIDKWIPFQFLLYALCNPIVGTRPNLPCVLWFGQILTWSSFHFPFSLYNPVEARPKLNLSMFQWHQQILIQRLFDLVSIVWYHMIKIEKWLGKALFLLHSAHQGGNGFFAPA